MLSPPSSGRCWDANAACSRMMLGRLYLKNKEQVNYSLSKN
jgi:hypothetical protein